ncbi:MAG: SDR family NAD(P)-dependent oxidoreductase [Muribaculaceae bacterium]|nr:SDR family NAD(P)-dependent oxidoreductase [Muribaculaceae bacterium]
MKKLIVVGASSGMGMRIATDFARLGWRVGIAARREDRLKEISELYPDRIEYMAIDVTAEDAVERFYKLIEAIGGMDYLLYAAGCGWQNPELDVAKDRQTLDVNVIGFTRIVNAAYKYYKETANVSRGHIAVITSVAGTKGIGVSATYSASKRYQWTYLQALDQLAHIQHVDVAITDIRPGFVDTPLLVKGKDYPMEMSVAYAAPRIERAMLTGRRVAVVDARWAVACALWRCIPDALWRRLALRL